MQHLAHVSACGPELPLRLYEKVMGSPESVGRLATRTLLWLALFVAPWTRLFSQAPGPGEPAAYDSRLAPARDSLVIASKHHTLQNAAAFAGLGVVSFGVLWVLPEDISKWPRDERKLNHLLDAFRRPPVWDRDPWFWNYAVHPVLGAYTYLAERNYGESPLRAFLFSTGASVAWEYGFEAWIEHPSAQDLLITSTVGSLLGELSYRATRRLRRDGITSWEKVVLVVINPVWVVQRGFRP